MRFALIRGEELPSPARKGMYIFCSDHGVVEEGVSAYPQSVTRQMVRNFIDGGAAINVLCRKNQIRPTIVDIGVNGQTLPGVLDRKIAPGTQNMTLRPAMSREEAERSIAIGRELAADAVSQYDMVGLGEMGIGNTTAATALLCVFGQQGPERITGRGAGLPPEAVEHKAEVIRRALVLHRPSADDPIGALASVGGFEMGAIAGFLLEASQRKLPVVLDGFPCCSGALIARALDPNSLGSTFFAHRSQEQGHATMLNVLGAEPLFDLGMRLGEGSGAALAMNLIDAAVRLYREMATFQEAGVSKSDAARSSELV